MRITHEKKYRFPFSTIANLSAVNNFVRSYITPNISAVSVVKAVAENFDNLEIMEVEYLIFDKQFIHKNHLVLRAKDQPWLVLDPMGDVLTETNPSKLRHNLACWIYSSSGKYYYSQNHMPIQKPEECGLDEDLELQYLIRYSGSPFARGFRVIQLLEKPIQL